MKLQKSARMLHVIRNLTLAVPIKILCDQGLVCPVFNCKSCERFLLNSTSQNGMYKHFKRNFLVIVQCVQTVLAPVTRFNEIFYPSDAYIKLTCGPVMVPPSRDGTFLSRFRRELASVGSVFIWTKTLPSAQKSKFIPPSRE